MCHRARGQTPVPENGPGEGRNPPNSIPHSKRFRRWRVYKPACIVCLRTRMTRKSWRWRVCYVSNGELGDGGTGRINPTRPIRRQSPWATTYQLHRMSRNGAALEKGGSVRPEQEALVTFLQLALVARPPGESATAIGRVNCCSPLISDAFVLRLNTTAANATLGKVESSSFGAMLTFETGAKYKRADVKDRAGLPRDARGGNWDTGVVEHHNEFVIFTNVGTRGRTGHDYGNRWENGCLRWYHKGGSHLGWPSVRKLLEPKRIVHVFWRTSNDAPFTYAGTARAIEIADTSPVEFLWSFEASPIGEAKPLIQSPEQVPSGEYREGAVRRVLVNAYERDRTARQVCINKHGLACAVCGLRFRQRYGALGAGFIHVHHVVPLSELGADSKLDPVRDLRPVCPNCHAMLHRRRPPLSIEDLRRIIQ